MSTSQLVSILLPTYNRADFLPKCIDSVLAQSYSDWELIISDDFSIDDTLEISQKYTNKDSRIHYHRNSVRLGLPCNRNKAITMARGKLILFVEDDLILHPNCLEILVKTFKELKMKENKIGAIAPRLLIQNEDRFYKGPLAFNIKKIKKKGDVCIFDEKTGMIFRNFSVNIQGILEVIDVHSCSLYRTEAILSVGGYEEKLYKGNYTCEEVDLNFRIRKKGNKLYFQPKAVVYHYKADVGGVRLSSPYLTNYYIVRNHIFFVCRNFGLKSLYMIPMYTLYLITNKLKHVSYNSKNDKQEILTKDEDV